MAGAIILTMFEQVLRWLVVIIGVAIILEFIWAVVFVPESRHARTFNIVKMASSVIIIGITINYAFHTPVVMPGAIFYLAAYAAIIAEIATLAARRRYGEPKARCPHCGAELTRHSKGATTPKSS